MKFKWSWKAWYAELIFGVGLVYFYIADALLNYEKTIETARASTIPTREGWYGNLLSILDFHVGKTATLIIIGTLTLIPFITAGYKLRKVIKKRKEQKNDKRDDKI